VGEINEVRRSNGPRCHDIGIELHKNWFRHSKVYWGGGDHMQHSYLITLVLLFEIREVGQND
jgi:hypothetical protein